MKNVFRLSILVLIICILAPINTYAFTCNVDIKNESTQIKVGDQFTVDIDLSNIQADKGVISFSTILDYDKSSLELLEMEGKSGWETPYIPETEEDYSNYNPQNGKMVLTRNAQGKKDETIFKITFKVKTGAKSSTAITLKETALANGDEIAELGTIKKDITISGTNNNDGGNQGNNQDNNQGGNQGNNNNQGNNQGSNQGNNNSQGTQTTNKVNVDTSTINKNLPNTGKNYILILIGVALLSVSAICFGIRAKYINIK